MINKIKIGDVGILVLILVASFSLLLISKTKIETTNTGDKYAIIMIDGKVIDKVKISKENAGKEIPIKTEFGYNVLEFSEDGVRSKEASCPDQIDVLQGFITLPGESIVCLPNRMVIEIEAINDINVDGIDAVN